MRVKDVVILRNEKTTDTSRRYIGLENITSWDAQFVETTSETEGTNNIFYPNDILFGKLRPYLAKGYIPQYEGICSTEFFVMSCKRGVLPHYLLYVFLSHAIIDYVKNQVAGVKMPRTNWNEFGNIKIVLPSLPDQQKIVSYLDEKTSAIDTQIDLLEKKKNAYTRLKKAVINRVVTRGLDEHVKLKDSGVEWIGMIPEHWEVKRIKDVASINVASLPENTNNNYQFRYIDISNVSSEGEISICEEMTFYEAPSRARRIIRKGDIIVSTVRTYLRSIAFIDFNATNFIASTGFAVLSPINNVESKYLAYSLRDCSIVNAICSQSTGVSYPAIAASKLASVDVVLPPLSEQQSIAAYLDEKCAKIDAALANIDKQMDALKRLKRSLINEVITGQRTV